MILDLIDVVALEVGYVSGLGIFSAVHIAAAHLHVAKQALRLNCVMVEVYWILFEGGFANWLKA